MTSINSFITTVTLDASSTAWIEHGVGKVPVAVFVQTSGPGQLATVQPSSYTDTGFRVKFNWHDGTTFKLGTKLQVAVMVTYDDTSVSTPPKSLNVLFTSDGSDARFAYPGRKDTFILNEVWNTAEAGPQSLTVYDDFSWSVVSKQPKPGANEGSVKSYPCTQFLFPKGPIRSLSKLKAPFWHVAPGAGQWNAAFDIWIGGLGSASTAEIMVWTDHRYPAALPPSNALKSTTVTLSDRTYVAWTRKNSNGGDYIALVDTNKRPVGTVDLLEIFNWLIGVNWLAPASTLAAVDYGIEISSTGGLPLEFLGGSDLIVA